MCCWSFHCRCCTPFINLGCELPTRGLTGPFSRKRTLLRVHAGHLSPWSQNPLFHWQVVRQLNSSQYQLLGTPRRPQESDSNMAQQDALAEEDQFGAELLMGFTAEAAHEAKRKHQGAVEVSSAHTHATHACADAAAGAGVLTNGAAARTTTATHPTVCGTSAWSDSAWGDSDAPTASGRTDSGSNAMPQLRLLRTRVAAGSTSVLQQQLLLLGEDDPGSATSATATAGSRAAAAAAAVAAGAGGVFGGALLQEQQQQEVLLAPLLQVRQGHAQVRWCGPASAATLPLTAVDCARMPLHVCRLTRTCWPCTLASAC